MTVKREVKNQMLPKSQTGVTVASEMVVRRSHIMDCDCCHRKNTEQKEATFQGQLEKQVITNIGLQFLASGLSISHEIRRISGEIHPEPYKFRCYDRYDRYDRYYDLGFHEIWGHSPLHAPPKLKSFC